MKNRINKSAANRTKIAKYTDGSLIYLNPSNKAIRVIVSKPTYPLILSKKTVAATLLIFFTRTPKSNERIISAPIKDGTNRLKNWEPKKEISILRFAKLEPVILSSIRQRKKQRKKENKNIRKDKPKRTGLNPETISNTSFKSILLKIRDKRPKLIQILKIKIIIRFNRFYKNLGK